MESSPPTPLSTEVTTRIRERLHHLDDERARLERALEVIEKPARRPGRPRKVREPKAA